MKARIEHELTSNLSVGRGRHPQLEHEPIARGRGKLEGLLLFNPVSVCEDGHVRKPMLAVERGHGSFGHRSQEKRLYLWARTVDLVEEKSNEAFAVAKQRSRFDARFTVR